MSDPAGHDARLHVLFSILATPYDGCRPVSRYRAAKRGEDARNGTWPRGNQIVSSSADDVAERGEAHADQVGESADTVAGATARGFGRRVGRGVRGVVRPVAVVVLRSPILPPRYQAGTWLTRIDLDQVVASIDLDQTVARVDLDSLVLRIDLGAVMKRMQLAGLGRGVIAEVDLAEIIRQSTTAVDSEAVRGVRMRGISGDRAVGRAVSRLRLRFSRKGPSPSSDAVLTPADP
jgi:hypothetical protein